MHGHEITLAAALSVSFFLAPRAGRAASAGSTKVWHMTIAARTSANLALDDAMIATAECDEIRMNRWEVR